MKKKGLIIATIVMVLVLAVSLTTATYAWFTATATASVTDLAIRTNAAEGLQIAMVNGTTASRYSGELNYDGQWTSDVPDWGSELNFANIQVGDMSNAVTKIANGTSVDSITLPKPVSGYKATGAVNTASPAVVDTTYYLATKVVLDDINDFKYGVHYGVGGAAELSTTATAIAQNTVITKVTTRPTDFASSKTYVVYEIAETTETVAKENAFYCTAETTTWATFLDSYQTSGTLNQDVYLVPTGYDAAVNPTGYEIASANSEFYKLTMAVTNTSQTGQIGFTVAITPSGSANGHQVDATNPGMTAALRMIVTTAKATSSSDATRTGDIPVTYYPYSGYKLNRATGSMTAGTADSGEYLAGVETHGENVAGTLLGNYAFLLDDSTSIAAGAVYYVDIILWVEGTDNECANQTAGTAMTIGIDFGYATTGNSIDFTTGATNGWFGKTSLTAAQFISISNQAQ